MDPNEFAAFWRAAARRHARCLNVAWWWQALAPLLIGGGAVGFAVLYWLRSREVSVSFAHLGLIVSAAGLQLAGLAWWFARPRFMTEEQGLVALDAQLKLHNALTAAAAGRRAWPDPDAFRKVNLRWSWSWFGVPCSSAVLCLFAAFWLPVSSEADAPLLPVSEPPSWGQMESWLETLQEHRLAEEPQIEEFRRRLEELRAQREQDWYSHQSLEATDAMRESLERSIEQMSQQLSNAARTIQALEQFSDQLSAAAKDQLAADFQTALEGLRANELNLDPELMKQLAQLDPKKLNLLSPEQLKSLQEKMKQNAKELAQMCQAGGKLGFLGDGQGADDEEMAEMMKLLGYGPSSGSGEGDFPGNGPGNGVISRGPGAAPLFLGNEESRLGTNQQEAVQNQDLSRAAPADLIGLGIQEHELDKTARGPQEAGNATTGQGGTHVWQERLSPHERAVLKRYFNQR